MDRLANPFNDLESGRNRRKISDQNSENHLGSEVRDVRHGRAQCCYGDFQHRRIDE